MSSMSPVDSPSARRHFLRQLFWTAGAAGLAPLMSAAPARAQAGSGFDLSSIGTLCEPDANGIMLPEGYASRVVAVSGERPVAGASYVWHGHPDGGATFATGDGGWVYANNSEIPLIGGAGALRFDRDGHAVNAYGILKNTSANCAGGPTPWGTWLSCEEFDLGRVWECNPLGSTADARVRPALGVFKHEAVAVDPQRRILYLTEDDGAGRFYRFVCSASDWPVGAARPALGAGKLQVLRFAGLADNTYPGADFDVMQPHRVEWVDAVLPGIAQTVVRSLWGPKSPGSVFKGGEGLWYFNGIVYFSTKGDNRIWAYDAAAQSLQAIYDFSRADADNAVLSGVDNLTVSQFGDVLVAEDGGNMELCVVRPDRSVRVLLRVTGQDGSELTGAAFSPDGTRLYFNSQRGARAGRGWGITYEVRRS
jgi:secreted PhoX family phosphatase